jgi:hypothetical protein
MQKFFFYEEMSRFYGGKRLSREEVHNWVANVSPMTKRLERGTEM